VFVVADACEGLSLASHDLALRRLEQASAHLSIGYRCCWSFSATGHATYDLARAIVVANGGGYGMGLGLAYALEMIHPA